MLSESVEVKVKKVEEDYEGSELREIGIDTFYSMQECMRKNGIAKGDLEIKIENMILKNQSPILSNVITLILQQAKIEVEETEARLKIYI